MPGMTVASKETTLKWIFRGNIVVPTANPFSEEARIPDETTSTPDEAADVCWLGPGIKLLKDHMLTVSEDGIIVHMAPARSLDLTDSEKESASFIELSSREFLSPGMIDLHIHAPQYAYTGTATDRPLMGEGGWLETYTFPAEQRLGADLDRAKRVYQGVVETTLQGGTTTAVYFATLDLEPCKVLVNTAVHCGQRALVGKVCMDRYSPLNYCQTLEQNLEETKALIEYIHTTVGREQKNTLLPLVLPLITPRFIPTCSPALLSALGELAAEHHCHITSHISESIDEVAFSLHLDATEDYKDGVGRTDAMIFESHGLLSDRCIMAHGVHLSDDDLDLMKERGSAVAHCPLSNFFFAGGSLPCRRLMERANKVGLGTDVAGGYSPSMLNSSRMAVVASRALEHQDIATRKEDSSTGQDHVLDYRHAFYLATLGGAEALGLQDRIGTFGVGMEFDAICLSAGVGTPIQVFDTDGVDDVFQKLCVLGDDRNVKSVYIQGRKVK
jgi:guanine deaminase